MAREIPNYLDLDGVKEIFNIIENNYVPKVQNGIEPNYYLAYIAENGQLSFEKKIKFSNSAPPAGTGDDVITFVIGE